MSRLLVLYLGSVVMRSLIIAGVAGILTIRVRSASLRHAVWTIVLASMLLIPVADALLPARLIPKPLATIAAPVQTLVLFVPLSEVHSSLLPPPTDYPAPPTDYWFAAAVLVVSVSAAMLTRMILAYFAICRMRRRSSGITATILEDLAGPARRRSPSVKESEVITVPLTVGIFRPAVILPSTWRDWEAWKLRAVLLHELTHVRRGDWAIAVVAAATRCVLWFNPLAWWIERKLSTLSEEASDEATVRWTGDAPGYAETLLHFASVAKHGHRWIGGVAMAQNRIGSRIERVLALRKPGEGIFPRAGWGLLTLLAVVALYASAAAQTVVNPAAPSALPQIALLPQAPAGEPVRAPGTPVERRASEQTTNTPAMPVEGTQTINPDLAGEIRLILAPVDAQNTQDAGEVQIQTRSGTNRYTGTAVWRVQEPGTQIDPDLVGEIRQILTPTANTGVFRYWEGWSAQGNNAPQSYGGPLVRNKAFFFASFDQQVQGAIQSGGMYLR